MKMLLWKMFTSSHRYASSALRGGTAPPALQRGRGFPWPCPQVLPTVAPWGIAKEPKAPGNPLWKPKKEVILTMEIKKDFFKDVVLNRAWFQTGCVPHRAWADAPPAVGGEGGGGGVIFRPDLRLCSQWIFYRLQEMRPGQGLWQGDRVYVNHWQVPNK